MFYPYPVYTFFQCKTCQKNILLHISGRIAGGLYFLPENVCLNCYVDNVKCYPESLKRLILDNYGRNENI